MLESDQRFDRTARRVLFLAVCSLGVSAIITQLTLMRELLSVFSGNELIFGIVLGNWLLLTGVGAALGRTATRLANPIGVLIAALVLLGLLPLADVFLLRTLRNVVFTRGADVGVSPVVLSSFVLLLPYCLTAGYLLTLACRLLAARQEASSIGQVYFLDTVGDVAGGLLFSFVLIWVFDHFGILCFPALLNLLFAALLAARFGRPLLLVVTAAVTAALIGLIALVDLDAVSTRIEYAGQQVVYRGHSPYGGLVVTESAGQYNFIENGVPLFSTQDVGQVEETVHYAMAQRPQARRVLLVGGGVAGTAREVLKYPVHAVDYVELDPLIVKVAGRYVPEALDDARIEVIATDGRLYVKQTLRRYDVVIVDVPDPSTSQLNRFYTEEFFAEVAGVLRPDGVLAFSLGQYENYVSPPLARLIAVASRTLRQVFGNVLILPGGRLFFLASDGELTAAVAERIERAGIDTRLVNRHYLKAMFTPDRLADVRRPTFEPSGLNRDFSPILYYYRLRLWMSQFQVSFGLLEAVLLLMLGLYLVRIRPVSLAVFTTGFAASTLEVVLLVGFQILYGSVYHQVGIIVTMFMLGLGIGSYSMNRMLPRCDRRHLVWLEGAVAIFAAGLPAALIALGGLSGAMGAVAARLVVPLLAMVLAVLVGLQFPLAAKADFREVTATAARLYTADYLGAALGALLVSTWLIPVLGVVPVCLLVAGVNIVSGGVLLVTSKT